MGWFSPLFKFSVSSPPAAGRWWVFACWPGSCRGCPWWGPSWNQRRTFWLGGWSGTFWSPRYSTLTGCGSYQSLQQRLWTPQSENPPHHPNHWPGMEEPMEWDNITIVLMFNWASNEDLLSKKTKTKFMQAVNLETFLFSSCTVQLGFICVLSSDIFYYHTASFSGLAICSYLIVNSLKTPFPLRKAAASCTAVVYSDHIALDCKCDSKRAIPFSLLPHRRESQHIFRGLIGLLINTSNYLFG